MIHLDAQDVIQEYLAGASAAKVADKRGVCSSVVKRVLLENNVPVRNVQAAHELTRFPPPEGVDELFRVGETTRDVAAKYGVNQKTAMKWRKACGFSEDRVVIPANELRRMYVDELISEKRVADHFKTDRGTIRRRLIRLGITPRGWSEAEVVKWSKMSQTQRAAQVAYAHAARRGKFEADVAYLLGLMSVPCRQSVAVGPYYVDIALDEFPVAVEVETRHAFAAKSRRGRLKYILNQGWCVLFLRIRSQLFVHDAGPRLQAFIDLARVDQSVFGKYGVIGGRNIRDTGRHYNFKDVPRVPGF